VKTHSFMTDIIYTNGDSFTHGVGLKDHSRSYTQLMATERNCALFNDAYPGSSHDRILRTTMKFVGNTLNRNIFVIIGWGFARRMEFYYDPNVDAEEDELKYIRYSSDPIDERTKHRYPDETCRDFILQYHEGFTNRNAAGTRALTRIIALQSFLETMEIPYLFFNSAWIIPGADSALTNMVNIRRYYGFQNPEQTFHKWTWNAGAKDRTELGHPDEQAHQIWFKNLKHYITQKDLWEMH